MEESTSVLGLACRAAGDRLSVWFVLVRRNDDGALEVLELDPWYATRGTDEGAQLTDVRDAIGNAIDARRLGDVGAVAVKRVEMPRGRPPAAYDRKVRFEAAAMLAATSAGIRYFSYRNPELKSKARTAVADEAGSEQGAPEADEALEALAAACAVLSDLG